MIISLIAAMANDRVIGNNNQLPWHLPADLKHFKAVTMGKTILMGRRTFESIGRALPGRQNIILTQNHDYQAENCAIVHSLADAIKITTADELLIIGGATLYQQYLPQAERMYLTFIKADIKGDTFFPEWQFEEWNEIERVDNVPDEKNLYSYSFVSFERC